KMHKRRGSSSKLARNEQAKPLRLLAIRLGFAEIHGDVHYLDSRARQPRSLEHRMRNECRRSLHFAPKYLRRFVGILLAAGITTHADLLSQHGKRREGVGFRQHNLVRVGSVAFMVKSMVFAENNPEILSVVVHYLSLQAPKTWRIALR